MEPTTTKKSHNMTYMMTSYVLVWTLSKYITSLLLIILCLLQNEVGFFLATLDDRLTDSAMKLKNLKGSLFSYSAIIRENFNPLIIPVVTSKVISNHE